MISGLFSFELICWFLLDRWFDFGFRLVQSVVGVHREYSGPPGVGCDSLNLFNFSKIRFELIES